MLIFDIIQKEMEKIKILLIEDNRLLREGIYGLLKKQPDMNVVTIVGNGENILALIGKLNPHIVLMDLGLRNQNSLQIVKLTRQHFQEIKVIVMDLIPLQSDVLEFVQAGVSGFILKDANVAEFYETIRSIYQGKKVLPPQLTGSLFSQIIEYSMTSFKPSEIIESIRMTKREQEVIKLVVDGCSNKEIAQSLHLSAYTIKSHIHNILEKLSLHSRIQIANYGHISNSYKNANNTPSLLDD